MKDFGTSQSSKIDSIFDSLFCPDRPAYVTIPYCTSTASCSCTVPTISVWLARQAIRKTRITRRCWSGAMILQRVLIILMAVDG
ncbi:MAG: hypothetical protein KZQ66_07115 [Candidatus Thiodiazotropha sp. (ex Lucinoma aequizonata)]|nr:hypothetical protein [Candidatus Thiodiazotropha sp. (ex Lucinoma aequizonata)]MCU7887187.1 hypothetical protein [Candidatus Thiodiazotropha sp. (ex Lucinoma aequizonata)]MCU7896572.1 hypothetical protein [Candidatus Thiodiazotropha sp. (ex Lucinoma aequizonata)]MCU7898137.1 hypothetical protein [Candidatus Thiodiazotropha sp. (ex Lucinoma aequizonata)]MCU7901784.1 hypothetical protein [Candidatus Thiodiazotropha sp. (ex Lucinoma aequizonata)]